MKKTVMILLKIFDLSKNHTCSIIYPEDVIVGKELKVILLQKIN